MVLQWDYFRLSVQVPGGNVTMLNGPSFTASDFLSLHKVAARSSTGISLEDTKFFVCPKVKTHISHHLYTGMSCN